VITTSLGRIDDARASSLETLGRGFRIDEHAIVLCSSVPWSEMNCSWANGKALEMKTTLSRFFGRDVRELLNPALAMHVLVVGGFIAALGASGYSNYQAKLRAAAAAAAAEEGAAMSNGPTAHWPSREAMPADYDDPNLVNGDDEDEDPTSWTARVPIG
jgi:hypothetical protein